jgi:hypothetical protein
VDRLPRLVGELVASKVDLIVAGGYPPALAAKDGIIDFNGAEDDRIGSVGPSGAGGRYWELQVSPDKSYYDMVNLGDTLSLPRESVFVSDGTDGVLLLDMDWDGDRETHIGMQGVTLAEFESSFII